MAEDYPRTLLEFERRFASEEACRQYLVRLRWPAGFVCPRCSGTSSWAMQRDLILCASCRYQASVMAGTIFQDSRVPLTTWFRAMWHTTNQKYGVSALGLQRALGLGSYRTSWMMLHKLRRAMVRPSRERLDGIVEVDEAYWGAPEEGAIGRLTEAKALVIVAAEVQGKGIGRIRMRRIPDLSRATLHGFIDEAIEPGSVVRTDGLQAYRDLDERFVHERIVQRRRGTDPDALLPRVHRAIALLKRWLMGTHQGAISHQHLDSYLDEFVFRFNRRTSASRGKLFYRLAQQAVQVEPVPYNALRRSQDLGVG
jgi:transposase-like protein